MSLRTFEYLRPRLSLDNIGINRKLFLDLRPRLRDLRTLGIYSIQLFFVFFLIKGSSMKYALLIGLSYPNTSYSLNAPIRDVNRIKDTLVGYEITLITDPLGSKENIVSCFLS